MPTVSLPDGTTVEFPEGTPHAEMVGALDRHWKQQQAAGPMEKAGRWLDSAWTGVKSSFTGDDRREFDLPELGTSGDKIGAFSPEGLRMAAAYATSADPRGVADVAAKTLPGATVRADKFGNPIVDFEGQSFYVNRPGLSQADGFKFVADMAAYAPAARLAGKAPGVLLRGATTAGATGAASIAQDVAAQRLGSEQPVDLKRAAVTGAAGGVFEAASPLLSHLYRRVVGQPELYDATTGQLTQKGIAALQAAGIDPAHITDDFAQAFAREARGAVDPGQAARMAEASALPVRVPMTRGQMTGRASDQMFEDLAAKGVYGRPAEIAMQGAKAEQARALQSNVHAIQDRLAGGRASVSGWGQAGETAQDALTSMRATGKRAVDDAYDLARSTAAGFQGGDVSSLGHFVGIRMGVDDATLVPVAMKRLETLKSMGEAPVTGTTPLTGAKLGHHGDIRATAPQSDIRSVPVDKLFSWRQETGRLAREMQRTNPTEARALSNMVHGFDEALPAMVDDALLQGDQAAIEAWKSAIGTARMFNGRFKGGDLVERLTATDWRSGTRQLVVPPDKASNAIFGSATLFGGQNTARDLTRLREVLGVDSEAWQKIREEAWLRLVDAGKGGVQFDGSRGISGAKFASAFDNAMMKHKAVMEALYSPDELNLMRQFRGVSTRATVPVEGGKNTSNTVPAMANTVQRMLGSTFMGEKAATRIMMLPVVKALYSGGMGLRAIGATSPAVSRQAPPVGLLGAFGADLGATAYGP